MKVVPTETAVEIVERAKAIRPGELVVTIGTGCCDSTAPFLYEDHDPGTDSVVVGEVAGVPIFAPNWVAELYAEDVLELSGETHVITETFSIEAEFDARLTLELPAKVE
ncbi:MAG: hypothetical protein DCC49_07900 [Acidobacteria bacterium]|nr:MAG: hypothetical protein DCC49_07900 [Acidobacteriota bacterium]